jgi:hypothetical protein
MMRNMDNRMGWKRSRWGMDKNLNRENNNSKKPSRSHLSMNLTLGYNIHHDKGFSGFMVLGTSQGGYQKADFTDRCQGGIRNRSTGLFLT